MRRTNLFRMVAATAAAALIATAGATAVANPAAARPADTAAAPAADFAAAATNLAQGRPTQESGHADVYDSSKVVDGNAGSYWESVNNSFPQWVQVDLGSSQSVNQVVLKLPTSGWGTRTQTLSVRGGTNGSSFTDLVGSQTYTFNPASGSTATINFSSTSTRYVRITITANSGWPAGQLSELEVYGSGGTTPTPQRRAFRATSRTPSRAPPSASTGSRRPTTRAAAASPATTSTATARSSSPSAT